MLWFSSKAAEVWCQSLPSLRWVINQIPWIPCIWSWWFLGASNWPFAPSPVYQNISAMRGQGRTWLSEAVWVTHPWEHFIDDESLSSPPLLSMTTLRAILTNTWKNQNSETMAIAVCVFIFWLMWRLTSRLREWHVLFLRVSWKYIWWPTLTNWGYRKKYNASPE